MTVSRIAILNGLAACSVTILCGLCAPAFSAEDAAPVHETREFKVSVDGAPRGKCTMQIHRHADGAESVSINSGLTFDYVVYTYRYTSTGNEVWKDGRLVELENSASYNGKDYRVKGAASSRGLQVTVNGKTSHAHSDVWVTSYWRLPARIEREVPAERAGDAQASGTRRRNPGVEDRVLTIALLNSDKGEHCRGRIQRIGDEKINVEGKLHNCTRYRIGGDVQVDLWYDSLRRLVRQESVDSGHRTVMELTRMTRK